MKTVLSWALACALLIVVAVPQAEASTGSFQVIVTGTPPGWVTDRGQWLGVSRYSIDGTFGAATRLADIPASDVADPSALDFRSPTELFVSNRQGDILGLGSISRFRFDASGSSYSKLGDIEYPGMIAPHGLDFHPVTGELFVGTYMNGMNGIFRFRMQNDVPVFNGTFCPGTVLDLCMSPAGDRLFVTSGDNRLRQFSIGSDGTVSELASIIVPGVTYLGSIGVRPDGEMYIADCNQNCISRYRFDDDWTPTYVGRVDAQGANGVAFSPDGMEMFVSKHSYTDGGLYRFAYQAATDSWTQAGFLDGPSGADIAVFVPVPEPASLLALLCGTGLLPLVRRRL